MASGDISMSEAGFSIPDLLPHNSNFALSMAEINDYPQAVRIIIEALNHCPLSRAFFATVEVPATYVYLAYSTSTVDPDGSNITFEVKSNDPMQTVRLRFNKENFGRLLGIPVYPVEEIESVPVIDLVNFINDLGCEPPLQSARLSDCKKASLPLLWNFYFGFCTRCLSSKTGGLDTASQSFWTLMYGLYRGIKVDYLSILWADFISTVNAKSKSTHLASHRFWAMVVNQAYQSRKIPYPDDLPKLPIQLFTDKRVKKANVTFTWIGQVSKVLLDAIPDASQIKRDYMRTLDPAYPKRPVVTEVVQPVEKKQKRKTGPSEEASPHKKKKKGDKSKQSPIVEPVIEVTSRSDPDPQWEEQERLKKLAADEQKAKLAQEEKDKAAAAAKLQKDRLAELEKKRLESEKQEAAEEARLKAAEEEKRNAEALAKQKEDARLAAIEAEKKAARDKQEEDDRLKAIELEKELEKKRLNEDELRKKQEEEEASGFYSFTPPPPPTWAMGFSGEKHAEKAGTSGSLFGSDSPLRSDTEKEAEDEIEMGDFDVDTDEDPDRDTDHVTRKEYKKMLNLFSILLTQQERQAKEIATLKKSRSSKLEKELEDMRTHVKVIGEHVANVEVVLQQCLVAFVELKVAQGRTLNEIEHECKTYFDHNFSKLRDEVRGRCMHDSPKKLQGGGHLLHKWRKQSERKINHGSEK